MFSAIMRFLKKLLCDFSEEMAAAIDLRDGWAVVRLCFFAALFCFGCAGFIATLTLIILRNLDFLVNWVLLPLLGGICLYSLFVGKKEAPTTPVTENPLLLEHAKQGLVSLVEIVFAVLRDMAAYLSIVSPGSLSELYCPNKSSCIRIVNGVAVVSVMVHYTGEVNPSEFLEMFNLRLSQRLDARDLPNLPAPVFYDSKNIPHTSIQAIGVTDCGGYLKLDVVRVTEEAVALIDAIAIAKTNQENTPSAPPVNPYF